MPTESESLLKTSLLAAYAIFAHETHLLRGCFVCCVLLAVCACHVEGFRVVGFRADHVHTFGGFVGGCIYLSDRISLSYHIKTEISWILYTVATYGTNHPKFLCDIQHQ